MKLLLSMFPQGALCIVVPALALSCSNGDGQAADASTSASVVSPAGGSSTNQNPGSGQTSPSTGAGGSSSGAGTNNSGSSTAVGSSTQSGGASTHNGASDTAGSGSVTSGSVTSGSVTSGSVTSGSDGSGVNTSLSGGEGTGDSATDETGGGSTSTDDGLTGKNAPVPSAGCGKANGVETLTAGGMSVPDGLPTSTKLKLGDREYIIDIPANYDPSHPYRLIFSWHQAYGSANGNAVGQYPANQGNNFDAQHYAYFGLHREATAANEPAIFVAPQGIGNFPWDYDRDVVVFDDLLALVDANLCIDDSRVFATGFSFGAMMSHALSLGRQSKLRAVVAMAPANYNFTQPTSPRAPFAYMGVTGMSDGTCPWVKNGNSTTEGGKYCVLQHAQDNGCTIPADIVTAMNGSKNHVCYDFEGCDEGYPVKVCTFDGNHTPSAVADGVSGGDDGLDAFVPPLAWEFISQF